MIFFFLSLFSLTFSLAPISLLKKYLFEKNQFFCQDLSPHHFLNHSSEDIDTSIHSWLNVQSSGELIFYGASIGLSLSEDHLGKMKEDCFLHRWIFFLAEYPDNPLVDFFSKHRSSLFFNLIIRFHLDSLIDKFGLEYSFLQASQDPSLIERSYLHYIFREGDFPEWEHPRLQELSLLVRSSLEYTLSCLQNEKTDSSFSSLVDLASFLDGQFQGFSLLSFDYIDLEQLLSLIHLKINSFSSRSSYHFDSDEFLFLSQIRFPSSGETVRRTILKIILPIWAFNMPFHREKIMKQLKILSVYPDELDLYLDPQVQSIFSYLDKSFVRENFLHMIRSCHFRFFQKENLLDNTIFVSPWLTPRDIHDFYLNVDCETTTFDISDFVLIFGAFFSPVECLRIFNDRYFQLNTSLDKDKNLISFLFSHMKQKFFLDEEKVELEKLIFFFQRMGPFDILENFLFMFFNYRVWGFERLSFILNLCQDELKSLNDLSEGRQKRSLLQMIQSISQQMNDSQMNFYLSEQFIKEMENIWPFGYGRHTLAGLLLNQEKSIRYTRDIAKLKKVFLDFYKKNEKELENPLVWDQFVCSLQGQTWHDHYENLLQMFMIVVSLEKKVSWPSPVSFSRDIFNFQTHQWNIPSLFNSLLKKDRLKNPIFSFNRLALKILRERVFFLLGQKVPDELSSFELYNAVSLNDHTDLPYFAFMPPQPLLEMIQFMLNHLTFLLQDKNYSKNENDAVYSLFFALYYAIPLYRPLHSDTQRCLSQFEKRKIQTYGALMGVIHNFMKGGECSTRLYNRSISIFNPSSGHYLNLKFRYPHEKDEDFLGIIVWQELQKNIPQKTLSDGRFYPYPTVYGYFSCQIFKLQNIFEEHIWNLFSVLKTRDPVEIQVFETTCPYFDYAPLDVYQRSCYQSEPYICHTSFFLGQAFRRGVAFHGLTDIFHDGTSSQECDYLAGMCCYNLSYSSFYQGQVEKGGDYPNVSKSSFLRDLDNVILEKNVRTRVLKKVSRGGHIEKCASFVRDGEFFKRSLFNAIFEYGMVLNLSFNPYFLQALLNQERVSDIMDFFKNHFSKNFVPSCVTIRHFEYCHPLFQQAHPCHFYKVFSSCESDFVDQQNLYASIVCSLVVILHSRGYQCSFLEGGFLKIQQPIHQKNYFDLPLKSS